MTKQANHFFAFGPFCLDPSERVLLRGGQPLSLTPKAFETLLALVEQPGHIMEKEVLMKRVWPDAIVEEVNLAKNISTLRQVLNEGGEASEYIETVPKRGYRFVANVKLVEAGELTWLVRERISARIVSEEETDEPDDLIQTVNATTLLPETLALSATTKTGPGRWRWPLWVAASVLLLGLTAAGYYFKSASGRTAGAPVKSLAVLPFKFLGTDRQNEYLGLGLTDALITKLGALRQVAVRPTSAITKYQNEERDVLAIGRALDVEGVLDGRVQKLGEKLQVSVQLLKVGDGELLWSQEFIGQPNDLLTLQNSIAAQLARFLSAGLTGAEQQHLAKRYTDNPASYQAYVKGRLLCQQRTTESFQHGIAYLNQALEQDARNALAWYALSNCYQLMGEGAGHSMAEMYQKATVAALKAVELDDQLAEAEGQLGFLELVQWYVASAERRLKRAIELNPNLAEVHARYGILLLAQGRFEEALAEARRCQELDPLALYTRVHVTRGLYMARHYAEAIAQCREYIRLDPSFATAHLYLGLSYYQQGKFAEALAALQQAVEVSDGRGEIKAALAQTHLKLGQRDKALKMLTELKEQAARTMQENYYVATIYAALGDKNQAFAWLEQAWQQRHPVFATRFKIDPNLDPLRSDPRYADLLRRTGWSQ